MSEPKVHLPLTRREADIVYLVLMERASKLHALGTRFGLSTSPAVRDVSQGKLRSAQEVHTVATRVLKLKEKLT